MAPKRILLVDDEPAFAALVQLNLEKTGRYDVCVLNNSTAVIATAREFRPHAVLLDMIMPGKDGGQVLADWRADPDLSAIPVVFLTATISQSGLDQSDGAIRGTPFLSKPIEPKKLIKYLDQLLK
jgi:CheY-like chemotaxis protein